MLVKNWMSSPVITAQPQTSLPDAVTLMREKGINELPVMEDDRLVGMISDRELKTASPSAATTLDMHELLYLVSRITLSQIMRPNPTTVAPDCTVEEAAALLLDQKISALPVVSSAGIEGIITRSDIFKVLISITGLGARGLQIAIRLKDRPGEIKRVRELIRLHGSRTTSILSSGEEAPEGFRNVYFRIYQMDREKSEALAAALKQIGSLLYVVDHRQNTRTVFADGVDF